MTPYQIAAVIVSACVALVYAWPLISKMTPAALGKNLLGIVAVGLLLAAFLPTAAVNVPAVEQSKVAAVLKSASKQDKARVRAYYASLADVVKRDDRIITTVGKFRTTNANALDLAFKGTDLPGKYAGLDVAIEDVLVKAIGKDDVALSPDKRASLVKALEEVAADAGR
jgi:hypothetical protein